MTSRCTRSRAKPSGTKRDASGVCHHSSSRQRRFNYQSWVVMQTNLFKKSLIKTRFNSPLLLLVHLWDKMPHLMLVKILVDSLLKDKRIVTRTIDSIRETARGSKMCLPLTTLTVCPPREITLDTWMDWISQIRWSRITTLETKWK